MAFDVLLLLHEAIMHLFSFLLLLIFLQQPTPSARKVSKPKQQETTSGQQASGTDQRGTEQSPLIVKTLISPKTQEETAEDTAERNQKQANDRHIVEFTGALVIIGFLQFLAYAYQGKKLRETVESAGEQAEAMKRHIGEAARSATAMETIAHTIEYGNKAITRAYLTVTVGDIHLFQERRQPGQEDLKFETRPNLTNTGNTPARNVCIQIAADILAIPIPRDFNFPLPENNIANAGIIGAHQTSVLAGTAPDFVPDAEIGVIKEGKRKALCVWGLITYQDIFGDGHNTKFAQWITWNPNGRVVGYYIAGQNDFN